MVNGREWSRRSLLQLALVAGILILAACRTTPTPTVTRGTPADATASPEPTTAMPESEATPQATASDTGPSTAAPTATLDPRAVTAEPVEGYSPTLSYDRVLRPSFQAVDEQFPDATRYRLDLALNPQEGMLSGSQHIRYTNTESVPLEVLYLRLFPNTPGYGGEMVVTSLTVAGEETDPVRELRGSALRVPLETPLDPGAEVDLTLGFTLALPMEGRAGNDEEASQGYRQLGIYNGVTALANAYPIIPVYDEDEGWNVELAPTYGDAVFSDVAFYDVAITAPEAMALTASGVCTVTSVGTAETTWSCAAAPMRDFNAVLGDDYRVESRDVEGITVNSVFYVEHEEGGEAALDYATRAVRLFNTHIGPYPFTELDVVETPTQAGGIEYPALVVINQGYYESPRAVGDRMEWVVVHEVLHQWWYSQVGSDQVDEPWLDEALVQYCTLLYYEEVYGQETAERLVERLFQEAYEQLQETGRDQPVGLPVASYSRDNYGLVVYQKGALYFHQLREEVGLDTFWEILQTYYEQNRYRIAEPEDWLTAVEAVTGSEHRALYKQWITE